MSIDRNENIKVETAFGSGVGVIDSGDMERLEIYLSELHFNDSQIREVTAALELISEGRRFSILSGLDVPSHLQGRGHGANILSEFLKVAHAAGSALVFLVCDLDRPQRPGFRLSRFYKEQGFLELGDLFDELGVMVKPL